VFGSGNTGERLLPDQCATDHFSWYNHCKLSVDSIAPSFMARNMVHDRIVSDPKVMFGKPVIRGSRITVELILRKLASGMTEQQILEHHPHLAIEDIRAAIAFAANHLAGEEIVLGSGSIW
jgi:uncharacterized protein (DUF433 family)